MDVEELIDRLRAETLRVDKIKLEIVDVCLNAAATIAALRVENQALRNAAHGYKVECEKLRGEILREKAPCTHQPPGGQENVDCD